MRMGKAGDGEEVCHPFFLFLRAASLSAKLSYNASDILARTVFLELCVFLLHNRSESVILCITSVDSVREAGPNFYR